MRLVSARTFPALGHRLIIGAAVPTPNFTSTDTVHVGDPKDALLELQIFTSQIPFSELSSTQPTEMELYRYAIACDACRPASRAPGFEIPSQL